MSRIKIIWKNARIAEEVVVQKDNDLDWGGVGNTIIPVQAKEYPLFPGTDNNTIYTTLEPGDNGPLLIKNDNTIVKLDSTIPKKTIDTVHTLDILGDNSCIACYPFDNNANDLSGKYNGTWQGTPGYGSGKFGQAAKFNGNDWIKTNLILKLGTTISFWTNEDGCCISALNSSNNGNNFNISRNGFNGGDCDAKINYSFTNGFYHIVVIIPESGEINDLEFYVNGVKQRTIITSAKNKIYSNGNNYLIFGKDAFHNAHFKGLIDQVRIFNRALTEDEIVKIYREQYTKYDISSLKLSDPPVKLFKDFEPPRVLISLEKDKSNFISNMVEYAIPVGNKSTNTTLVTADMLSGEKIIVDGKDFTITNNNKLYRVDASNVLDILGDNSCVACYPFAGNANDLSGKYNGIENNINYVDGKFGQCIFTNVNNNSYVEVDNIPKIFDETEKTFSCWVANVSSSNQSVFICSAYDDDKDDGRCFFGAGIIAVFQGNDIEFNFPKDDDWHHYLFTVGSEGTKVYIDGNLVAADPRTIINDSGRESRPYYCIGNHWNYVTNNNRSAPNIKIDQVRIFNRALTEDEVKIIYEEQYSAYDISSLGLIDTPKSVIRKGYLRLIKESSTTSEFIGISNLNLPLKAGDTIITDQGEVVTTSVNISNVLTKLDILGDNSCIACYPLDGNANDLSGKYNGTWKDKNGNTISGKYGTGKFGQAASFDGNNAIVIDLGFKLTCPFTITGWVKKEKIGKGSEVILGWDYNETPSGKEFDFWIRSLNGGRSFYLNVGAHGRENSTREIPIPINIWVFYIAEFKNTGIRLKMIDVNGKVLGDEALLVNIDNSLSTKIALGAWIEDINYSGLNFFMTNGLIDQVRIFNRALTEDEIVKIYGEQCTKYTIKYNKLSTSPKFVAIPQKVQEQPYANKKFNGTNFELVYNSIVKQGRAIQRKFIVPDNSIEILPPIKTQLYKVKT